ncbi:MAG TPA: hypothetical protein VHA76_12880 [Solirubrobacterales bacterium]|nr:hypothetical protein [Solirubrobacterales bacterium]
MNPNDSAPANANSLRGSEFWRLLGAQKTWFLIGLPALAVFVFTLTKSPSAAWIPPLFVLLIGLGVVFWVADRNAANRFWELYSETRGLELGGQTQLPKTTPFLRQGGDRYATRTLSGELAPGIVGTFGLFTYEEVVLGNDGGTETRYYRFTFAMAAVPECVAHMPELYVKKKSGHPRSLQKLEDVFRVGKRRVTLESAAVGRRYEIFVGKEQDEVWTRRLFSPSFIVWLAESSPQKFSFELVDGTLVAYIPGQKEDAPTLDLMAASTATIARRLLEESAQTSGASSSAPGAASET